MFFPVVQLDTRFQTNISGGKLYTNLLFDMIHNDLPKIQSFHTDEGKGLIKSIEDNHITNYLCVFHMLLHCKEKSLFLKLVNAADSKEYAMIKEVIMTKFVNLRDYLNSDNRWRNISRFESSQPRD